MTDTEKNNEQTKSKQLDTKDLEKIDLQKITNLNELLSNAGLTKDNLLENNYKLKGKNIGFINAKNENTGEYYNFYVNGKEIENYSIQHKKEGKSEHAVFRLYDVNGTLILTSEVDKHGDLVSEEVYHDHEEPHNEAHINSTNINKAAFKWACIFSSYVACISVALAAGAAGTLVSGPFGTAAGFAGGAACRYIFQTAVDKYGSKEKACKILS